MSKKQYDLIVIGGGSAGLVGAKLARGLGKSVAIIEKNKLGGECTWTGCIPSKTLIYAAKIAYDLQHYSRVGLSIDGIINEIGTDKVMHHVRSVVEKIYATHTPALLHKAGIDTYHGTPHFIDTHTIEFDSKTLRASKFLIASGSHAFIPPINGIEKVDFLTNETLFSLDKLPDSLLILGGGPIGIEMASALNRLGVRIIVIELHDRILAHEDKDLTRLLRKKLHDEGIVILNGKRAIRVIQEGEQVIVYCIDSNDIEIEVCAQRILVATGRRPNIEGLDLEKCGVHFTKKGIVVDQKMRTSTKHIYAAGDVVGSYQFSHIAEKQAQIAVRNALLPFSKKISMQHIGWVTFCSPELARGGLTEQEARDIYKNNIRAYTLSYEHIDRGHTDNALFGYVKVVCDKRYRIVGIHILGERAGELLHELQIAKTHGIPLYKLHDVIHAYPTFSDIIKQLSKKCYIDYVQSKWFIKLAQKIFGKNNDKTNN